MLNDDLNVDDTELDFPDASSEDLGLDDCDVTEETTAQDLLVDESTLDDSDSLEDTTEEETSEWDEDDPLMEEQMQDDLNAMEEWSAEEGLQEKDMKEADFSKDNASVGENADWETEQTDKVPEGEDGHGYPFDRDEWWQRGMNAIDQNMEAVRDDYLDKGYEEGEELNALLTQERARMFQEFKSDFYDEKEGNDWTAKVQEMPETVSADTSTLEDVASEWDKFEEKEEETPAPTEKLSMEISEAEPEHDEEQNELDDLPAVEVPNNEKSDDGWMLEDQKTPDVVNADTSTLENAAPEWDRLEPKAEEMLVLPEDRSEKLQETEPEQDEKQNALEDHPTAKTPLVDEIAQGDAREEANTEEKENTDKADKEASDAKTKDGVEIESEKTDRTERAGLDAGREDDLQKTEDTVLEENETVRPPETDDEETLDENELPPPDSDEFRHVSLAAKEGPESDAADRLPTSKTEIEEQIEQNLSDIPDMDQKLIYQGMDEYDLDGIDVIRDGADLDPLLEDFQADTWQQLSQKERECSITSLSHYLYKELGLEHMPRIEFYHNEDPTDFGGYHQRRNALELNDYVLNDGQETIDTVAHELWHAYQYQRAGSPRPGVQGAIDWQRQYGLDPKHYIAPIQDASGTCINFEDYHDQLVEAEARSFAGRIKTYFQAGKGGRS